jgi:hypothetical protein
MASNLARWYGRVRVISGRWPEFAASLLIPIALTPFPKAAIGDAPLAEAKRLVAAAAQAEVTGDIPHSFALLRDAARIDPENELARWQLGQMSLDGKWLTVEEAQHRASIDPRQAEYRTLRAKYGESPEGQLALARWCRKNGLNEEARVHWASVLWADPNNEEALRAVNMRWHNGHLLTPEQVAQQKKQVQAAKQAAKRWSPKIAKWRRDVAGHDLATHDAALAEIRAITADDAISAMEDVTLGRDAFDTHHAEECLQIAMAFLDALEKLPDQAATESLARHAVFSPGSKARASAIEKLKARDPHDFVPLLLGGLKMPLESSYGVRRNDDGSVHYTHMLFREGQNSDWSFDLRLSAMQNDLGGRPVVYDAKTNTVEVGPHNGGKPSEIAKRDRISSRYVSGYGGAAAATELQVARINNASETLNALIMQALTGVTGQKLDSPKDWWNWWRDENEYYASDDHPVDQHYYSNTDSYYYGGPTYEVRNPPRPPRIPGMSCFAKGTPVWTKTGRRPIESLELGDLVLSQDISTGELKYQPVIGRTVRPPSPIIRISLEGEELRTTKGHPFWVAGVGWRMAKELGDGAVLHGVIGASRIRSVKPADEAEAYNLVVADFSTYFVGESGLLVHDNTARQSTAFSVPGVAAK